MNNKKSKGLIFFNIVFFTLIGLVGVFALYLEFFYEGQSQNRDLTFDFVLLMILAVLVLLLFLVYRLGVKFFPNEYGKPSQIEEEDSKEPHIPEAELGEEQLFEESCWKNIEHRKKKETYFFEIVDAKRLKTTKVFFGIVAACYIPLLILSIVNFARGINFSIPLLILVLVMAICFVISIFFIGRATFMEKKSAPKPKEYEYVKLGAFQLKVDKIDENTKKRMEIFAKSLSFALGLGAIVLFVFVGIFMFSAKFVDISTFFKLLFGTLFFVVNLSILFRWMKLLKTYTYSKEIKV